MKEKKTLWVVIVLLVVLVLIWILAKNQDNNQELPEEQRQKVIVVKNVEAMYSNGDVELTVLFNNTENTVSFFLEELGELTLNSVVSASGARYSNEEESIVLWEHQGEVTITLYDEEIYKGALIDAEDIINTEDIDEEVVEEVVPADHPILASWQFDSAVDVEDNEVEFIQKDAFTLNFTAEGMANGTTDCNNFFGPYNLDESALHFGPLASTMMYCEGSQEGVYTDLLAEANSYEVNDDQLTLNLADGGVMQFVKQ